MVSIFSVICYSQVVCRADEVNLWSEVCSWMLTWTQTEVKLKSNSCVFCLSVGVVTRKAAEIATRRPLTPSSSTGRSSPDLTDTCLSLQLCTCLPSPQHTHTRTRTHTHTAVEELKVWRFWWSSLTSHGLHMQNDMKWLKDLWKVGQWIFSEE